MKKVILISLLPIFVFLFPIGMMTGVFFLTGCTPEPGDRFVEHSNIGNKDTLFSESRYPYLNQFFGYPDYDDLMNVFYFPQDTMDSLAAHGLLASDDWVWFKDTMWWMYDGMDAIEEEYSLKDEEEQHTFGSWQDAIIDIADMMHYTGMGTVFNQAFDQLGANFLTHHLHPILEYLFSMDIDEWEQTIVYKVLDQATNETEEKISEKDFKEAMQIIRSMLDNEDEVYGEIWKGMPSALDLIDTMRTHGDDYSIDDVKDFIANILEESEDLNADDVDVEVNVDEELMVALADAMEELWDEEDTIVIKHKFENGRLEDRDEYTETDLNTALRDLLNSVSLMITEKTNCADGDYDDDGVKYIDNICFNSWDQGDMTDFARVLHSLTDLLNPATLPRDRLRAFMEGLIFASAKMDGADSINGIFSTYYNPVYFAGFDDAVDYIFKHNKNNVLRTEDGAEKISALRVLLYMVEALNKDVLGELLGGVLYSPDGVAQRSYMLDFAMGEATIASKKFDDPFDYLDYAFYQKPYFIGIFRFEGMFGMLESFEEILMNPVVAGLLDGLMGLPLDSTLPAAYVAMGLDRNADPPLNHETGKLNQLMFFAKAIEHFYLKDWKFGTAGWEHELMQFAMEMNEISDNKYFKNDNDPGGPGVLQTVEGPNGYGLATFALRSHGEEDEGLLDPVLYMLSMIVNKLHDTEYGGGTLWDALMDNMKKYKIDVMGYTIDIDEDYKHWVSDLFGEGEDEKVVIDEVQKQLNDNHDLIVALTEDFGGVLTVFTEPDRYNKIIDDIDTLQRVFGGLDIDGDTEFDADSVTTLTEYLSASNPDGSDNKFVAHLKAILIKLLDIYITEETIIEIHNLEETNSENRAFYWDLYKNYESVKLGAASEVDFVGMGKVGRPHTPGSDVIDTLSEMLTHLIGDEDFEGGVYSVNNIKDFISELSDSNIEFFGYFVEEPLKEAFVENSDETADLSNDTSYDFIKLFTGPAVQMDACLDFLD